MGLAKAGCEKVGGEVKCETGVGAGLLGAGVREEKSIMALMLLLLLLRVA